MSLVNGKLNTVVLEDEDGTRKILIKCLEDFPEINIVGEAKSLDTAFQLICEKRPQAAFMDIKLIGGDVFSLLERLKNASVPIPKIVLITGFPDFAIQSLNEYRNNVVKYLMKPFLEDWETKFRGAIDALMAAIPAAPEQTIQSKQVNQDISNATFVKSGKHLHKIPFDDLIWIEVAGGGAIYLVLEDKEIKVDSTLAKFMSKLPSDKFHQISREYAVNVDRIMTVDKEDRGVMLNYNGKEKFLGIGDAFYSKLLKRLK